VHRRDSLSLSTLTDKEIQQRTQLGLITAPLHDPRRAQEQQDIDDDSSNEDLGEWQDFSSDEEDEDDDQDGADDTSEKSGNNGYKLAPARRSSVDLHSIAGNRHDAKVQDSKLLSWQDAAQAVGYEDSPSKRVRNSIRGSSMGFASIDENAEEEEEDVETVNGEEVEYMEQESS
jgi:hypothetical protein